MSAPEAEKYVVFARRFRPQNFAELAGQDAVATALQHALVTGRLAQAYMFCGPRGVGKTSLARIIAKALNCLNGTGPNGVAVEPCNNCHACETIQSGAALDVIEMDAATNRGIEEVRSLRDSVGIAPAELRYKVYIIDEVHMLTREAWNAFLKTLEEPPARVKFIFATTDPNQVPETILSRCQRHDLRRIGPADIVKRLKQICDTDSVKFEETALSRIAALSRGGLRDAESLLDQAVNLGQGTVNEAVVRELSGAVPDELLFAILKDCAAGQAGGALLKAHQAIEAGSDPGDLLELLCERARGFLMWKVCGAESPLMEGQIHLLTEFASLGGLLSEEQALMLTQVFNAAKAHMRDAALARLPLELALIKASRAKDLCEISKLVGLIESAPAAMSAPAGQSAPATPQRPPVGGAGGWGNQGGGYSANPQNPPNAGAPPRPNTAGRPGDSASPARTAPTTSPTTGQLANRPATQPSTAPSGPGFPMRPSFPPANHPSGAGGARAGTQNFPNANSGVNRPSYPPQNAQRLPAPSSTKPVPDDLDENVGDDDSYIGFDELPLTGVPPLSGRSGEAPVMQDDDDAPAFSTRGAPPMDFPVMPKSSESEGGARSGRGSVDFELAKAHPLVNAVLKATGGVIMNADARE